MERKKALFEKPAKKQKKEFKNIFEKKHINKNMRLLVTMVH